MYNKFIYSRKLESKPQYDHYLKYILLMSNCDVICFFQSEKESTAEYQVYQIEDKQPYIKKTLREIEFMTKPFEIKNNLIGFFNNETMRLWMFQFQTGLITQAEFDFIPTIRLTTLCNKVQDDSFKELYFAQCLKYSYMKQLQLLIIHETFNVFDSDEGRCNENYFQSWNLEQKVQIAECNIKEERNLLVWFEINDLIFICKQSFTDEEFKFYLWNPLKLQQNLINIKQFVNITIIKAFLNTGKIIIKEEDNQNTDISQTILITANANTSSHPILLNVEIDSKMNLKNFTYFTYQLDNKGCILFDTPWLMENELFVYYYTKTNFVLSICDINKQDEQKKLLQFKLDSKIPTFYFSKIPKYFIEQFEDYSNQAEDEEILLPNKTSEVTQIYQHLFVPYQIHYLHFLKQTNITELIGANCIFELIHLVFNSQPKAEKQEQI